MMLKLAPTDRLHCVLCIICLYFTPLIAGGGQLFPKLGHAWLLFFLAFVTLVVSTYIFMVWLLKICRTSHCTECGKDTNIFDRIPVVGNQNCRYCDRPLKHVYPNTAIPAAVVTIIAAPIILVILYLMSPIVDAVFNILRAISIISLVLILFVDTRRYKIPVWWMLLSSMLIFLILLFPEVLSPASFLFGAIVGALPFVFILAIGKKILKCADVISIRYIILMACVGGLWGYEVALVGTALGVLLSLIYIGIKILLKKSDVCRKIPFTRFFGGGMLVAILVVGVCRS
jgi:prepilin signal peptidase PulO-like enzyme (type II secretory pathway)